MFDLTQILSLVGAAMVLGAFLASSYGRMTQTSLAYGLLNCVGTGLLAWSALNPLNLGVVVLESVWCVASLGLCIRAVRGKL